MPARVTTLFNEILDLPGVWVRDVTIEDAIVTITVALRRRLLVCPHCEYTTTFRHNVREVDSCWQHLDVCGRKCVIRCRLRRLCCPTCGVITEAVPFARPVNESDFTYDFEYVVCWLAIRMDKTALSELMRIAWRTVGSIIERVVPETIDPERLENVYVIGVDEISWRKHHNYLTLVIDHHSRKVVWGHEGRDAATFDRFFDEIGPERASEIEAVSMDMGPAYRLSVKGNDDRGGKAPQAEICYDPFHVVALGTKALDEVRRDLWNELRCRPLSDEAKLYKGARWSLLKRPEDLTDRQKAQLNTIRKTGGADWRAYQLRESLRAIYQPGTTVDEAATLLDRWFSKAQRCRLEPFVKLQRTLRKHLVGILAAIRLGVNNGRVEGLNNRVRLLVNRAFGFHSAKAALALVMLACGPVTVNLPR